MELLTLVFGFWLFLFSKMFRESWIFELKKSNPLFKFLHVIEAGIAILIGLGAPVFVIKLLIVGG